MAFIVKGGAVCQNPDCGLTFPRDPVLVACPTCRAPVGVGCRRPSGHSGPFVELHAERDLLADREGKYGQYPLGRCGHASRSNPQASDTSSGQLSLFCSRHPRPARVDHPFARRFPKSSKMEQMMSADLFRRIADAEGWSDVTQIGILLRFIEAQRDRAGFFAFLTQTRAATTDSDLEPADRFMWEVIEHLGNPGLAITAAFQEFCLNTHDLLTRRQAAERWCCWSVA